MAYVAIVYAVLLFFFCLLHFFMKVELPQVQKGSIKGGISQS